MQEFKIITFSHDELESKRMGVAKLKCKCGCGDYQLSEKVARYPYGNFYDKSHADKWIEDKYKRDTAKKIAKAKRAAVEDDKAFNRETKRRKENIKPKSKWLSEAQSAFNKYIRIRDYNMPCIACLKPKEVIEAEQGWKTGGCWDSGHFKTRGAKGQLRFVLFNAHKQCKSCNAGSGKFSAKAATVDANYRVNLIKKIGIHKVELLDNNNDIDLRKGDIEYLKRIKNIFNKKARLYEKRFR